MRYAILSAVVLVMLAGCSGDQEPPIAPDIDAGKKVAAAVCRACHGLDGRGAAPGIPHLAAQTAEYLDASLLAYQNGSRRHAGLRDLTQHLSDADLRNVAGYYASRPPLAPAPGQETREISLSLYDKGEAAAAACASCHGADGNSEISGTPRLAGQQPLYFASAVQAYLIGGRDISTMESALRRLDTLEIESLALFYAVQKPAKRGAPPFGDPVAGEPLSAQCGGCHGARGVSHDAATPSLAGQDPRYLVSAIKAYERFGRKNIVMHDALTGRADEEIEHIAAFYATQEPQPAEEAPVSIQKVAEKCDRCHGPGVDNAAMLVPKIDGQNKDYLIIALRAYRDDRRESSMMHKMSLPYNNAIIEGVASFFANRPMR